MNAMPSEVGGVQKRPAYGLIDIVLREKQRYGAQERT